MWGLWILIVFFFSYGINAVVKRLAPKIGAVDVPGGRRGHDQATPTLGGVSIYLCLLVITFWFGHGEMKEMLMGATVIVLVGVWDDIKEMKPRPKFIGQAIGAFLGIAFTVGLDSVGMTLFALFWFVLLMNAVNFMDGMDGLTSGVSVIILCFFGWANPEYLLVSLLLVASIIGFFVHNESSHKLFLGDTGSMLIGYILAYVLSTTYMYQGEPDLFTPFLFTLVMVADLVYVCLDRMRRKVSFWQAESNHLHHRLRKKGWGEVRTLLFIFLLTATSCWVATL